MADKKPPKGILKHSSSLDHPHHTGQKEMKWDEMNILATHHPPDKTYGHMKIDEPPTPYSKCSDVDDDDDEGEPSRRRGSWSGPGPVSPSDLASKLEQTRHPKEPDLVVEEEDSEEEEEEELTDEERARKRAFELKRKLHYNEFQAVQLAKKLLAQEEEEDEEEEASPSSSTQDKAKGKTSNKNNHTPEKRSEDLEAGAAAGNEAEDDPSDVAMASDARGDRREEPIEVETGI